MSKPKKPGNYPVHQSPLYKLRNKRKLATHLRMSLPALEKLAQASDNYRVFPVGKRTCHEQKPKLKALHKRLQVFLNRIAPPNYLHSATKGRSYISNAEAHLGNDVLHKLDIRHFYDATTYKHAYDFYKNTMECSRDVATLLAKLSTYNDHLPTGSPLSPILAYYAHKQLFDSMHYESTKQDVTMTCYVDDLTFSGASVPFQLIRNIKRSVARRGLEYHKEKSFPQDTVKIVTGVGIRGKEKVLPNKRHLKIYEEKERSLKCTDEKEKRDTLRRLISRTGEASRIDATFEPLKTALLQVNKSLT